MINPKQNFIEIIFGPIINFFETKLILSGGFVGLFLLHLLQFQYLEQKTKRIWMFCVKF